MDKDIIIPITIKTYEELSSQERLLIDEAKKIAEGAYAPYSQFSVGAAVLLENGQIITGSNQENAAYPSGTCAERTAIFYANSQYPDVPVVTIAIIAINGGKIVDGLSPCGACRQVLAEVSTRYRKPYAVIMAGSKHHTIIKDNRLLLPLTFDADVLNDR
ncbi:cytidine deaminase [Porphyromonas sp.]|uniref:cytidine deaminase n=1 Tax=Porphyromonas sp. TaxID=1924944 RepID=UPI0026DBF7E5|nr:cytidine deaminase [Porphyromonas sp.]MDO4771231.1 cytidine deaminase [Porphyromonas sp.]